MSSKRLYLPCNNEGVTKEFRSQPDVDERQTQQVSVLYDGPGRVLAAEVRYVDSRSFAGVSGDGERAELTLYPGETAVIEFELE